MLVNAKQKRLNPYEEGAALARRIKCAILTSMAAKGVTKAELARRMGVSNSYLVWLWHESPSLNLRKVAEACVALGEEGGQLMAAAFGAEARDF